MVFTYTAKLSEEYEISENVKLPEITVTIKAVTEAFDQSTIIDNIKITVKADEGVFPKDSSLKAVKIDGAAKEELKDAVEEMENPEGNSQIEEEILEALEDADLPAELAEDAEASKEEFHAFDITILDKDGYEIQPDNSKGQVSVSFSNPNPEFATSEYTVYHQDEASGVIEELPTATNSENMVEAEATSFSPYILSVFTGNTELQLFELTGNETELTKSGIYYVNKDLNYTGADATSSSEAGGNGLKIASGVTAYIYIAEGAGLTATGGKGYDAGIAGSATMGDVIIKPPYYYWDFDQRKQYYQTEDEEIDKEDGNKGTGGSGATAGGAGIFVPAGSTLAIIGSGTIKAQGGNGGNGTEGGDGAFTKVAMTSASKGRDRSKKGYNYGYATTGSTLSNGGSGTITNDFYNSGASEWFETAVGAAGGGGGGAAGGGAGIGSNGTAGSAGTDGATSYTEEDADAVINTAEASKITSDAAAIGNVYINVKSSNITGGRGGSASTITKTKTPSNTVSCWSYWDDTTGYIYLTHGQPGGNGAAGGDGASVGKGGKGGTGGKGGDSGSIKTTYNGASGYAGTSKPGSDGTLGNNGDESDASLDEIKYPYNTVTFTGASSNATQTYYLSQNGTVTAPSYTAPSGNFEGWKVMTPASPFLVSVQGAELITAGKIYQAGARISTQGIYGNVVLEPVISEHRHFWSYEVDSSDKNTILAYCMNITNADSCDYQGTAHAVKLVIDANDVTYTGTAYADSNVTAPNDITAITGATASAVAYYADEDLTQKVTPQNVGTYYAVVTIAGLKAVDKFNIIKKQIMIPAEDTTSFTYNGSEQTYVLASSNDYSITGNKRTDAGSQKVTVSLKDKNNTEWTDHTTDDKTYTFNIAKADPGLSVSAVSEKTYGDADFDLQITNHGDAAPTYQSSDENVLNVKDGKVTLVGAGKATVTVSVAETGNYKPDQKTVEITVNKKAGSLTVSKMAYEVTYGTAAFSVEGLNKVGDSDITYASSDESVVTVSEDGKISNHKVGKATVTLSMAASTNYKSASVQVSVNVVPKKITVTADELSKTYGDSDPKLTWKPSELVGKDQLENISIQRTAGEDAGKYTVTVGQTAGSNSNYEITFKNGTFTINPKKVTVTADTKSKTYGSDDPKLTWQETGVKAGDELKEITAVRASGQNVGTYNITLSQKEGANPNYAVAFVGNTFTITPKTAKVIVDDKTKTYGDKDEKLTYTTEDLVKGDNVDVTISREAGENVGTYKITASQAAGANSNYKIAFVDGTYTISKRKATVTADDKAKTYGDRDEKLTCTPAGLVEGDSLEKITLSREAGEDVGTYKITAVQEDGANKNYDLTFKTGTYTIGQKAVTVTAADDSKIYGDTDPELTYSKTELVGKDTLSDITVTREAGENVGTYVMTASQKDGANKNYSITFKPGTFTIKAKEVTLADKDIVIDGDGSFVYDGTEKSPTVVVMDGDKVIPESEYTVTYANNTNASEDTKEADQKPVVIITDNKGGNYVVNGSKTFEIAKADPTLSVSAVPEKTYGDAAFTLEVTKKGESTPDFASSDEKVLTVDKDGKVTLVGAGKATVTVSMAASRNYKEKETKVEITVKKKDATLSVSKIAYEVTYGDPDFKIGEITKEGESGVTFKCADENVVTVDETGAVSIRNVGEATIKVIMDESTNYNTIATDVTVKVLPKNITVTADDKTKTYADQDEKLTYTAIGLVGEAALEKITLSRKEGEDVGDYLITVDQEDSANPNYAITFTNGTYTIVPKDITGAAVELDGTLIYNGKEQTQNVKSVVIDGLEATFDVTENKATKAGEYVLKITGNGNFTGTIEQKFTIEKLPGNVSFAVEADGSAPHTEIGNSEQEMIAMLASAQELEAIENGDSLKIWVEITDASATVSETSKQLIQNAASDYKVGAYLDISLFKKLATADQATQITGTSKPITVSVTIPENLRNSDSKIKRTYAIVRVHDGAAEILPTTQNGNTLTFTTDKFSDYAIMYKDEKVSDNNGGDNNNSNNNSGSNNNGSTGTTSTTTVPKTGDETNIMLWVLLMMLGLSGMVGTGIYRRKSSKNV